MCRAAGQAYIGQAAFRPGMSVEGCLAVPARAIDNLSMGSHRAADGGFLNAGGVAGQAEASQAES